MLETKAGELAGAIWTALNENKEGLTQKALKKVICFIFLLTPFGIRRPG